MLIIGYWIASVLGHLEISLWLVQRRESDLLGTYKLADLLPHAGALLLAAVVIWQARRAWFGVNHTITLAAWAVWLAVVVLVDRFLIYSFPEYLHYPQYALLAWMIARLVDPDRTAFAVGPILLAVTVLGIADEVLQYTWITISYSNYLDFNDFLLNLLGGAAGLLLHYGFAAGLTQKQNRGSRITPRDARPSRDDESGCHPELDSGSSKQISGDNRTQNPGSRITPRCARRFQDDGSGVILNSIQDPVNQPSGEDGHKTPEYQMKPGIARMETSTRHGLLGFAWLGTAMLLSIAAINITSTDPELLQSIERQPSYNTWIPGPHAGLYYVLDPVTGTLILVGLGALASAAPLMSRRKS